MIQLQAQLFRVITVEEQDDINYAITALSYVNAKYAFIENGASITSKNSIYIKSSTSILQATYKLKKKLLLSITKL